MIESKFNRSGLKDFEIPVNLKLAALWASVTFFYIYGNYFELYVPNKIAGITNGISILNNPIKLLLASFLLAIPAFNDLLITTHKTIVKQMVKYCIWYLFYCYDAFDCSNLNF
jgi:hypothetical protein